MSTVNKVLFVFGFVLILAGLGCRGGGDTPPAPDPTKPDYDFSDISKQYLYFLPNTYWVYQDDSTLNAYSVKLFSAHEEIRQNSSGSAPYSYNAYWMYYSNNNAGLQKGEMFATNFSVGEEVPNTAERVYFGDQDYKIAFAPMYPFGQRILLGGEEGTFINKELLDTLVLNGKTYNDVYHSISEDYETEAPDTIFYHFYFAKNYGLIKYTILGKNQGTSFSLLESSIIQQQ